MSALSPISLSPTPYSSTSSPSLTTNSRRSPTPNSTSLTINTTTANNNLPPPGGLNHLRSKSPSPSPSKERKGSLPTPLVSTSSNNKLLLDSGRRSSETNNNHNHTQKTKDSSPTLGGEGGGEERRGSSSSSSRRTLEPISNTLEASTSHSANPLEDLIKTETLYVQDLGVIIKRVAAAWSRTNFPPPALDAMFRAVEAVYRVNKGLLAKLNDIGPNPASPKALGDLLMRWIPEIEPSYHRYATTFQSDFDFFEPIQSNLALGPILLSLKWPETLPPRPIQSNNDENQLETSTFPIPPPPSSTSTFSSTSALMAASPTLDDLFQLPILRLKYYSKLYSKLLKSTQSGRSDHDLLVAANGTLDTLLSQCDSSKGRSVAMGDSITTSTSGSNGKGKGKGRGSNAGVGGGGGEEEVNNIGLGKLKINTTTTSSERNSLESTGVAASSESDRLSATSVPSVGTTLSGTPRIEDLERRLCTDRALDIFTMLPKKCKLQMAPPNLNFQRQIRKSADVVISFQPLSDTVQRETIIRRAYIFLLTDLFLVCERMTPEEKLSMATAAGGPEGEGGGPDMWLMYPPLAGKHLRCIDGVYEAELEITVMMKEKLVIKMESIEQAQIWKGAFEEAISFGSNQGGQGLRSPGFPPLNYRNGGSSPSSQYPNGSPILSDFREELRSPGPFDYQGGNGFDNGNNNALGYGRAPPSRSGSRAFSNGSINVPPPRKQSTGSLLVNDYGGGGGNGRSISNSSSNNSLNGNGNGNGGNYPLQNEEFGNGFVTGQQPDYSYFQSPNSSSLNLPSPGGPNSNNQGQPSSSSFLPNFNNGFGLQLNPSSSFPSSSSSSVFLPHSANLTRSGSSISSSSGPSPGYSEPPPLPSNKQFRFDQRGGAGGPTPTSRRTDPANPTDLLSPGSSNPGSTHNSIHRSRSADGGALRQGFQNGQGGGHYRLPSQTFLGLEGHNSAPGSTYGDSRNQQQQQQQPFGSSRGYDDSPPPSPMDKQPEVTSVVAQMRCKAFLQQNHAQWKALGTAKVKLFASMPSGTKQLVVESDKSDKKVFVSTIVLTDGVERVGKTGVAIELSDRGSRTGIVYMLQMKTEQAATGLFEQLLLGSGRKTR